MRLNLFAICMSSFAMVFFVLTFLAIAMRLIIVIFPERKIKTGADDAAIYAAITSTYSRLFPGVKITKIEEKK